MSDSKKYVQKLVVKASEVKDGDELWLVKNWHPTQAHKISTDSARLFGMPVKVRRTMRNGQLHLEANSWTWIAQESATTFRKWRTVGSTNAAEEYILVAF